MPTTIRDIAKKLNLSIAAVSRALDGYPDISAETRRRVQETAREMGYAPNQAARQLRRRRADAIGYILPVNTPRLSWARYLRVNSLSTMATTMSPTRAERPLSTTM